MSAFTDPQHIKATARAIYEGGREHPLADLARLIEGAISDAKFQGLAPFDVARWVAHVVTEELSGEAAIERAAKATYAEGAFCGTCEFEGWDSCADCRRCNMDYARAVVAALQEEA